MDAMIRYGPLGFEARVKTPACHARDHFARDHTTLVLRYQHKDIEWFGDEFFLIFIS